MNIPSYVRNISFHFSQEPDAMSGLFEIMELFSLSLIENESKQRLSVEGSNVGEELCTNHLSFHIIHILICIWCHTYQLFSMDVFIGNLT